MSDNMLAIEEAVSKCALMRQLVECYEAGIVHIAPGIDATISAAQITALKQSFAAARVECKAALNSITG